MTALATTAYPLVYVDDEQDNLDAFRFSFRKDFDVRIARGGEAALELLGATDAAVIVADQRLPGMTGIQLLEAAHALRPEAVGILLTAYTDLQTVIQALNSNLVYRYLTKPWDSAELRIVLRQAIERHVLFRENRRLVARLAELNAYLTGELRERFAPGGIVGSSPALQRVLEAVAAVAPTTSTVLIRGESGTGKELVARALHDNSPRAQGPFIRVACAALSPGVLESELFGHEKGAFTGAHERKPGRFELADGGTLFLDEVGDLPEATQVKLLRALQEREIERVGGTRTLKLDVRIVAATHRHLEALVSQGLFREDLYFRLNVFPIQLPPLRERREDIPLLVEHFLARQARLLGRPRPTLRPEALQQLLLYPWPGNVRELENLIERASILARGTEIGLEQVQLLPPWSPVLAAELAPAAPPGPLPGKPAEAAALAPAASPLGEQLEELERRELVRALQEARGSKAEAARLLGIQRSTLYYRLKKHGLDAD